MSKIVILGAGYAGMMTAAQLDRMSIPFTIINNHPYHYLTTLLHEAAGGRSDADNYKVDIKEVLRHDTSELVVDEVTGIDREKRVVTTKNGEYAYDTLIYALGWVSEYFGIKGMKENTLSITDLNSAIRIRQHIEDQFAAYVQDQDERHLRIVVGGAGLTGIELLGELLEYLPGLAASLGVPYDKVDIQCIEAMPFVLPQVPEVLRPVVMNTYLKQGANIRLSTKIMEVAPGVVHLDGDEKVEAGTILWTGGVRSNPMLENLGFTVDRRGRGKVNEFNVSVDDENIYIAGDSAWFEEDGRPLPPTAQVASQQGHRIAHNLAAKMHGKPMVPFHASLKGTLASLGADVGVGDVAGIPVKGVTAALFKEATKVKYLWELGGVRLAGNRSKQMVHII